MAVCSARSLRPGPIMTPSVSQLSLRWPLWDGSHDPRPHPPCPPDAPRDAACPGRNASTAPARRNAVLAILRGLWGDGVSGCGGMGMTGGNIATMPQAAPALALRAKPLRVLSLRASIGIALALCLTGCERGPDDPLLWHQVPTDPQVENFVFSQCLTQAKGPTKTHYNDWDEAIDACGRWAADAARYCPAKAKCTGDISTRDAVRAILPAKGENQ